MIRAGKRNAITDVDGIRVGSAQDGRLRSGVTVVLPDTRIVAAVDTRGGAPGTREGDLLDPANTVERIDAVVLSGGSAFGLDAASGVTGWLARAGRGFEIADFRVPIVPAAIVFDLPIGGRRDVSGEPYAAMAAAACAAASHEVALGNAGAGMGATAGVLKGGQGTASFVARDSLQVGALAIANPFGSVTVPGTPALWAAPFEQDGELGGQPPLPPMAQDGLSYDPPAVLGGNTTLAVVATNLVLTRVQAKRLAIMAHDGFARAIRPVHTPFDGDTIFVLATGTLPGLAVTPAVLARTGMLAADCVARAIARGVYHAETLGDFPSYRSKYGAAFEAL